MFQYADKNTFFGHAGMITRAAVTAIDNNKNIGRAQATTADGQLRTNAIHRRYIYDLFRHGCGSGNKRQKSTRLAKKNLLKTLN